MGRVTFSDTRVAHVFSPVTGRIVAMPAVLCQGVDRGAPLAIIDSPDLASAVADLQKAEAELHRRVEQAAHRLGRARRDVSLAAQLEAIRLKRATHSEGYFNSAAEAKLRAKVSNWWS